MQIEAAFLFYILSGAGSVTVSVIIMWILYLRAWVILPG